MIETGFGKEFSEPPNVTVSATRTHCEACKEPLDPNVMHKCHGNKEYEPPAGPAHPDLTSYHGACPNCNGTGVLYVTPTRDDAVVALAKCEMCAGNGVIA